MNYSKWLEENISKVRQYGYGAIQLRINIKAGEEDIIEKVVIITDKNTKGTSICASV